MLPGQQIGKIGALTRFMTRRKIIWIIGNFLYCHSAGNLKLNFGLVVIPVTIFGEEKKVITAYRQMWLIGNVN